MRSSAIATLALLALAPIGFAQDACVPQRVISPPEISTPDFGFAAATNGTQWFVSSTDANTLCPGPTISCSTGAVFVYDNIDGGLVLAQTIVPPDVTLYDNFGFSLDVDGDRLAIGSLYARHPTSGDRTGAVFVYEFDGTQWVEVERVWPPTSVTQEFAVALELAGETMFVRPLVGSETLVYTKSEGAKWTLKQTLEFPGPPSPDAGFGGVWAIHKDWIVTGSYLDRRVAPAGGSVQIYRRQADGTIELFQEILSEPEPMYLGITLDFIDDTLVVGAPAASRDLPHQGVVQFYEFDGERWTLQNELTQTEPREDRWFGSTLIVQDHRLFVSAFNERTAVSRGLVYEFAKDAGGAWIEADRFVPESAHYAGHYGTVLASAGDHLLVGASRDETATGGVVGGAYFFDLACGDCKPDLDADGAITIYDFLTFFNLFDDGDTQADFDGDGELTIFDFLAFQTAFDAGCE